MAWLVALVGSVTGFLFGYDEGIIAGSLALVRHHFNLNYTDVGIMISALPFGALIGSMLIGVLLASYLSKRVGRRFLLFSAGIFFLIGALGTALSWAEWVLILSRFVLGMAIGVAGVTTPLYLAETAPASLRGAMVAIYQLAITMGILCAYVINYVFIEQEAWRSMFASSAIPAGLLILGVFLLPESPRWLLSVGKEDFAEKTLKRLRKNKPFRKELADIKATLAKEPQGGQWTTLFKMPLLSILMLGMILFCFQQLCGINVIIYFAPEIFKNLGFTHTLGQILATIGIGFVNLLVTILAIFYVDKLGRRKLLLIGFSGAGLSLGALSVFAFYQTPFLAYLSVLCLVIYIFSFAISLGPIPHIVMSEIFPLHVRGMGMGFSSLSNWGFNTLTVFSFPLLYHRFGLEFTFTLYATVCVIGLIYTYYCMPETKSLSLEAIEAYLLEGKPLSALGRTRVALPKVSAPSCPPDSVAVVYQGSVSQQEDINLLAP